MKFFVLNIVQNVLIMDNFFIFPHCCQKSSAADASTLVNQLCKPSCKQFDMSNFLHLPTLIIIPAIIEILHKFVYMFSNSFAADLMYVGKG